MPYTYNPFTGNLDYYETTVSGTGGGGITDHSALSNLDYASAGHTGFQSAGEYATDAELITVSGDLQTNIDGKSDTGHTHTESDITDLDKYTTAEVDALTWTESDITDLDKYTQAEVNTISGSLQTNINTKDNYSNWSFAVDGVTKDAVTSGDILNFVGGDNIAIIRSAYDEITISGTDAYETIYIDAAAMVPCTTNGALQGTNEYSTNDIDIDYFAFDSGSTEERVQFKLKMPENWNKGTIKVKFDWSSATGSTVGDSVEWAIKSGALSDNDPIDAALGTPQVISDILLADNGTNLQTTSATPALTVGGSPAKNDLLIFEVYRNTDGTDDCAEDALLFGCTIQYKKSGSTTAW